MIIKCKMCGGDIEFVTGATYGTCEYCGSTSTIPKADDEGKLNGSALNRAMRDSETGDIYDIVAGTFIVCGCGGENFSSLTEAQQKKYLELYRWPERFFRVHGKIKAVRIMQSE